MHNKSAGLAFGLFFMAVLGLALIIGPFFVPEIQGMGKLILAVLGGLLLLIGIIGLIITKLYVRTKPDLVFIRTGAGGARGVIDGGSIVIPVIHTVKFIPTNTMKIDVERTGHDALLTKDNLRAKIRANFYLAVPKEDTAIIQAAASLPDMTIQNGTHMVQQLIEEKLIGALRTVAALRTLEELNSDRHTFADEVQKIVSEELTPNGLKLESVNISGLDQEDPESLRPDTNIFDAQGMATITAITARNRVIRTQLDNDAEKKVKDETVATQKYLAEKDREVAEAVATADAEKLMASTRESQRAAQSVIAAETETRQRQAELNSKAAITEAEQRKLAETQRVATEQAVAVAEAEKEKAVAVKDQETIQATQVARVEAVQAQEVADRKRQVAVAEAEGERATAEAKRIEAEALKATADQSMQTSIAVETARRESQQAIIGKEALAKQQEIEQNTAANVQAYAVKTEATAAKEAASNRAEAVLVEAKASKEAAELAAQGQKATALVPVEVKRQEVEVDRASVEVLTAKLEAESANAEISVQRELGLALISAMQAGEVARAAAMGESLKAANIQIWGDANAMKKISEGFAGGQAASSTVEGFLANIPLEMRALLSGALSALAKAGGSSVAAPAAVEAPADKAEVTAPAEEGAPKVEVKTVVEAGVTPPGVGGGQGGAGGGRGGGGGGSRDRGSRGGGGGGDRSGS